MAGRIEFTNDLFTIFAYPEEPYRTKDLYYAFDNITAEKIVDGVAELVDCWHAATLITQRSKVERESGSHGAVMDGAL